MEEPDPSDPDDLDASLGAAKGPAAEGQRGRIARALKLSQLFERASGATRDRAIALATLSVVPGGALILQQGATPHGLLVIGRGRVRVERASKGGRVVPLGYRGTGEVLGEACLGHATEHGENATAMDETELIELPLAVLDALLAADLSLGSSLLGVLLTRQREAEDRIESLLFRNVEGRVVEFLLKAAERWGVPSPKGTLISAPITHLEIAQSIGSTRETVTLTLGALRREGLLDVAGRRLIVKNREALASRYMQ